MSLTGRLLPAVLIVVLVAGLIAALLVWPRVRGPRWARRGQRFALLVVNQVVAVALVGVVINDAGDFYSSWSDLFGTGRHQHVEYAVGGGTPVPSAPLTDVTNTTFSSPGQRPQRGRLFDATVAGATSGLAVRVEVYQPPQYFQAAHEHDLFPVVEVVDSGQGASVSSDSAATATAFLRELNAGRARPGLLVMVDATGKNWNAACVSSASGPQTTSFLDTDLPLALANADRVHPVGWGITGLGAGGYCAAKLALSEPDVFWAAAAVDAYFVPRATLGLPAQNDLLLRLRSLPLPPARLLLLQTRDIGSAAAAQVTTVRSLTGAPMQVAAPTQRPVDYQAAMARALEWLTARLAPAAPG